MEINLIKELHGQLDTSADSADMFQRGTESGRISNNRDKIFFFLQGTKPKFVHITGTK